MLAVALEACIVPSIESLIRIKGTFHRCLQGAYSYMCAWRLIDALTWSGQLDEERSLRAWIETHPDKAQIQATNCKDVKEFWRSPIGRINLTIWRFNTRLLDFIKHPRRRCRALWWKYDFYIKGRIQADLEIIRINREREAAALQQAKQQLALFRTQSANEQEEVEKRCLKLVASYGEGMIPYENKQKTKTNEQ